YISALLPFTIRRMKTFTVRFSYREELANAISHLTGALLATAGLVLMVVFSAIKGSAWHVVSSAVFGTTMIILYVSSTLNHWLKPGRVKDFFFNFDQIAIFMLIVGTYTPLTLVALHGAFGWVIFGIEWSLAVTGTAIRIIKPDKFESGISLFFILTYVIMGWIVVIAIVQVLKAISLMGFIWILIGGLCYSLGILFFRLAKFRFHHLIWHIFVIAGSISHFFAIYFYILPIQV
ncbi:MAG: hemolysin III family protein, partial [Bacteroidales bacterium]